jgi:hypothetical protein
MKWRRYSSIRRVVSKGLFPEDRIVSLAESGVLKKIAERAIHQSKALGLPVTIVEDGILYRIMPDGCKIKIKDLPPVKSIYKRGHIFSIKAAS